MLRLLPHQNQRHPPRSRRHRLGPPHRSGRQLPPSRRHTRLPPTPHQPLGRHNPRRPPVATHQPHPHRPLPPPSPHIGKRPRQPNRGDHRREHRLPPLAQIQEPAAHPHLQQIRKPLPTSPPTNRQERPGRHRRRHPRRHGHRHISHTHRTGPRSVPHHPIWSRAFEHTAASGCRRQPRPISSGLRLRSSRTRIGPPVQQNHRGARRESHYSNP
jgi:hypothetical protein